MCRGSIPFPGTSFEYDLASIGLFVAFSREAATDGVGPDESGVEGRKINGVATRSRKTRFLFPVG
jgi:hypothetical protein